jgi:hypothetical protein
MDVSSAGAAEAAPQKNAPAVAAASRILPILFSICFPPKIEFLGKDEQQFFAKGEERLNA